MRLEIFSGWSKEKKIAHLALSTFYIKALWLLHPDIFYAVNEVPVYAMFPFSKQLISKPTYISMICMNAVWLIIIRIWWLLLPSYKAVFAALFIIQALQFVEFFLDYNETQLWVSIGRHKLGIDLSLAKLIIPAAILMLKNRWMHK